MPDRVVDVWGERTPYGRDTAWPVRVDQHLAPGVAESDVQRWVPSACVLCSNGCGCEVAVADGRLVGVRGRATDAVNRLGPEGLHGSWQWNGSDRLTGLGTPHMDGNTRMCTATAAAALKESFGSDGQPGCYAGIDACDALFLFGHNMAETQTVLWSRVLDRLAGPGRPMLVAVDPRRTAVARAAEESGGVHWCGS